MSFDCKMCSKCFGYASVLSEHVASVHGGDRYTCEHCSITYTRRPSLFRHLQTVHKNPNGHTCSVCGKVFRRKDNLKSHTRRKH